MKTKIKIFLEGIRSLNTLENEVNCFLKTLSPENIIEIKHTSNGDAYSSVSVMVVYRG